MSKPKAKQVKRALGETIERLRRDIEAIQEKGGSPADYSLGFTNGLIFVEHRLSGKAGHPKFYDRKMAIGILPMPVKFQHEAEEEQLDAAEYDMRVDNIIDAARLLAKGFEHGEYCDAHNNDLADALKAYDDFVDKMEEKAKAEAARVTPSPESSAPVQEASNGG